MRSLIPKLTNAGRGLLIRALSGETLTFTKIKIGSGDAPDDPASGDYWYDTANHQLYTYDEDWATDARSFAYDSSAPALPSSGDLWYDTENNQLKQYAFGWSILSALSGANVSYGTTAPENPSSGDYWVNTSTEKLMVYSESEWVEHSGSTFTYGATAPASPSSGDFWCNTSNGYLYVYGGTWGYCPDNIYFDEPVKPKRGDLWYNATAITLKVYASTWSASTENITRSIFEPATPSMNDLWYDTANGVLKRYNGAAFVYVTGNAYSESSNQPGNADDLTDLINTVMTLDLQSFTRGANYVSLTAMFDNSPVTQSFRWTETGIFAADSDGNEVLYAYAHAGDLYDTIPANNIGRTVAVTLTVLAAVDDAENVTAVIGESSLYATQEQLQEHLKDYNNPHKVTKEQIGLGNVENVAPSDMVISYEISNKLEEPESGEKLSTFMGKVKRAIKALIAHLKATNPHGITCETIGAATADHSHGDNTPVVGHYVGNGATKRFIELGFIPAVLIVSDNGSGPTSDCHVYPTEDSDGDQYADWEHETYGGIATPGYNAVHEWDNTVSNGALPACMTSWVNGKTAVMIGELNGAKGFFVGNNGDVQTNYSNRVFTYIAFPSSNANAVNAKTYDAMGTYVGNGAYKNGAYQGINVGFTPSYVLIYTGELSAELAAAMQITRETPAAEGPTYASVGGFYAFAPNQNLYHSGCGSTYYSAAPSSMFAKSHGGAAVITGGFGVQHDNQDVNANGKTYTYFAWK